MKMDLTCQVNVHTQELQNILESRKEDQVILKTEKKNPVGYELTKKLGFVDLKGVFGKSCQSLYWLICLKILLYKQRES